MKSVCIYALFAATAFLSLPRTATAADAPASAARQEASELLGRLVLDFVVPDSTGSHQLAGKPTALSDFDSQFIVAVFMGTACPIANSYIPTLNALQERYQDQGVQVIGINSNLQDSADTIRDHAKEYTLKFPVLIDSEQVAADMFGATRTPQVFILDRRRHIRYHGRIDDRIGYDFKRARARRADTEEALKELVNSQAVSVPVTQTEGCLITRRTSLHTKGELTFANHIAEILHKRCAECHHPGTAAPFSLLTYEDARDWSQMIRETVVQRRMPPWSADSRHGDFSNTLRLTTEEVTKIVAWIDAGAPEGNPKETPEAPKFEPGWLIGKPDKVFKMPHEYTVRASGTVEYKYFVTPTKFEQDMWIQAAEARPGNRDVVHHIIAFIRPPGGRKDKLILNSIGGYAPGEEPVIYPLGVGKKLPAGWEIVWQMHYTPTGKVEKDRSELGLIFCKEPPQKEARSGIAANNDFTIPANAGNHAVTSQELIRKDVDLLTLMPHMHVRGKSFRYTARFPDGRDVVLLSVPDYDFNWQHRYRFAEPLRLPKGTLLRCEAFYDNSAENPANPDPEEDVRWGDQTWEEMMIGFFTYIDADTPENTKQQPAPKDSSPPASASSDAQSPPPTTKENDDSAPIVGRVVKRTYHFAAADKDIEYRLYVPKSYDGSRDFPLIVALHGLYSSPSQIISYPGFVKRAEQHGYIVVAAMGYNTRGWYGSRGRGGGGRRDPENLGELSEQDVMNVLKLVRSEFQVDAKRIYLYGHSMGGGGSLHLSTKYPDIWAGMAVVAPATNVRRLKLEAAQKIPAIVIQGTKDRLVPVRTSRQLVERMKELEIPNQYIEVENGGHVMVAWQHFDEIFEFWHQSAKTRTATSASPAATVAP